MRALTAADIMLRARRRCGQDKSTFISDTELLEDLDSACCELYDVLVAEFKDYFIQFATLTTSNGVNVYNLPANFYKLRGLDLVDGNFTYPLKPFAFENRHALLNTNYSAPPGGELNYCILGNTVMILPTPPTTLNIMVYFVPEMDRITSTSQFIAGFSGWEEVIINELCARCAVKAEEDPKPFLNAKEAILARMRVASNQRDIGVADTVLDVTGQIVNPIFRQWR